MGTGFPKSATQGSWSNIQFTSSGYCSSGVARPPRSPYQRRAGIDDIGRRSARGSRTPPRRRRCHSANRLIMRATSRVDAQGVSAAAFEDALKQTSEALAWLRARHADGGLPLLALPGRRDDLASIGDAARRLSKDASDIVILGTGGSSLGGQTLAQLAGHAVPGVGALRPPPRLHFMDNLDPETYGTLLATASARDQPLRGDLEIGRHRRDPDADHGRARGCEGEGPRGAHPRIVSRPDRARQGRQAQRAARPVRRVSRRHARARSRRRRALFGAHQCGPASGRRPRPRYRGDP